VSDPECTVVVCTRQRPAALARCLAALDLDHPSYEVLVVDNSAGDPDARRLAADAGARYVVIQAPGLSRARNAGARAARGAIVAFIDDDAVPERDWLRRHADALADRSLAASTGRILAAPAGSPAARAYAATGGEDLGEAPSRLDRGSEGWFERANFGGAGVGANMALRRELFDGWGFREGLGPVGGLPGEEHYAFFELVRDGHAIGYEPAAVVHHDAPATVELVERRMAGILRGAVAYLLMLLVEQPRWRRAALRYMLQSLRGRRRGWRAAPTAQPNVDRGRQVRAALGGLLLYVRCRRRHGGRLTPPV
jgi:glycosyltransferase involved in cell wall biosynthesis